MSIGITADLSQAYAQINNALSTPILDRMADYAQMVVRDRFVTKIGPDNTPWAPLAERTLKYRMSKGNAHLGQLVDTGALRNSIKSEVTPTGFTITATDRKAIFHQNNSGYTNNKHGGPIPNRPFMGFSPQEEQELHVMMERWIRSL